MRLTRRGTRPLTNWLRHCAGRACRAPSRSVTPTGSSQQPDQLVRGQVLVEFALALIGIVVSLFVVLKVWMWLTGMIVERQAAFQGSREQAGKVVNTSPAGRQVPFQREPLRLMGNTLGEPQARAISLNGPRKTLCDDTKAQESYKKALVDDQEANLLRAGPIQDLRAKITFTNNRICQSKTPDQRVTVSVAGCDVSQANYADCVENSTTRTLAGVITSCGKGSQDSQQDGNWARCGPWWFTDSKAHHNSGWRRRKGQCCMENATLLGKHIESLGDRLEVLENRAEALEKHRGWLFQQGDCACPLTRGEKAIRDPACDDPEPSLPPPPSESIPDDPATRPC